jgi:hypothetical protein
MHGETIKISRILAHNFKCNCMFHCFVFNEYIVTLKFKLDGVREGRDISGVAAKMFGLLGCYAFPLGMVLPTFQANVLPSPCGKSCA